jgi:NAD(P)-dependent dehydrogenase (short-subunit alcohol dehydrogenase family)
LSEHPAIEAGRTAVITGGASGIGLATAKKLAGLGMNVVIFDREDADLEAALEAIAAAKMPDGLVIRGHCVTGDVAKRADLDRLRDHVLDSFGDVALLMNNAGVGRGGGVLANPDDWRRVIDTNLFGVLNGVQAFAQTMIDAGKPAAIVNTGSKQGITCPPGDTAYNVSKAGIKALTEGLAHTLRNIADCPVSAHLLVPGSTFTGMTARRGGEKPPGAWWPDQVADFMLERMAAGDFYILCPDNDVTREMDNARMTWAMQDLTQNRPPLSRWHPDYEHAFAEFLARETGRG